MAEKRMTKAEAVYHLFGLARDLEGEVARHEEYLMRKEDGSETDPYTIKYIQNKRLRIKALGMAGTALTN